MYNGKTVSLDRILWKVIGRGGIYDQLNEDDAALYATEALRLLGAPLIFQNKISPLIHVENRKFKLPSDLIDIRGIRLITNEDNFNDCPIPLRHATDIYHESAESCDTEENRENLEHPLQHPKEYTYTVSAGIVTTSFIEGPVQVSYKALLTNDEGYPCLPDNMDLLFAVEYHIRWRFIEPLWEMGKVTDKVYNNVTQQRDWYMGAAANSMQLANMDHVESTMNAINRLILPTNSHSEGFKRLGVRERIKKYS